MAGERRESPSDVRVLVVDDQDGLRRVLCELVERTSGFCVVADVGCGVDALEALDAVDPELVLMDVHMPDLDGIATARMMIERRPDVVVLLISADEPVEITDAVLLGAAVSFRHKAHLNGSVLRDAWEGQPR